LATARESQRWRGASAWRVEWRLGWWWRRWCSWGRWRRASGRDEEQQRSAGGKGCWRGCQQRWCERRRAGVAEQARRVRSGREREREREGDLRIPVSSAKCLSRWGVEALCCPSGCETAATTVATAAGGRRGRAGCGKAVGKMEKYLTS
jgi:hypothetical protein